MTTLVSLGLCFVALQVVERLGGWGDYGPVDQPQDLTQLPNEAGGEGSEVGGVNEAEQANGGK